MRFEKHFPLFGSLLLTVGNLFLITLPLFRFFSFEFSVANAIVIAFISGWFYLFNAKLRYYFLLLAVPLLFGIFLSAKNELCSFSSGLEYYFVFTFPSALIGAGLGALANLNCTKSRFALYPVLFFTLFFSFVIEIYFRPNIYFFNSIIGFFPGTIYDESLQLSWKHYSYRLLNILFFLSIIIFEKKTQLKDSFKKWMYLPFFFIGIVFYLLKPAFGFSTDESTLREVLYHKIETDNFIIFTDVKFSDEESDYIKLIHEFYFEELKKYFKTSPKGKINSYLFSSDNLKRELIGAGNADLAKPWRNEIFLNSNSFQRSLKHEIAHVFAAQLSTNYFKVPASFNSALIEGIAVAAEDNYGDDDLYSLINLANENNFGIRIEKLFGGLNFFGQTSSRSYLFAGGFIKYLVDKYGINKFQKIYDDQTFQEVYGKNILQLESEFNSTLASISVAPNKSKAEYFFGRKSIVEKTCPRVVANKTAEAYSLLNANKISEAEKLFTELLIFTDDYDVIYGKVEALKLQNKFEDAINLCKKSLPKIEGTAYYYLMLLRLADFLAINNEAENAEKIYEKLSQANPNVRIQFLTETRSALLKCASLKAYLAVEDSLKPNYLIDTLKDDEIKWGILSLITLKKYLTTERTLRIYNKFISQKDSRDFGWNFAALKLADFLLEKKLFSESEILYQQINAEILVRGYRSFYNEVRRRINYFNR